MGISGKEPESNNYKLREILADELGNIFVYDRIIQNNIRRIVGGSVISGNVEGNFIGDNSTGNVSNIINKLPSSSEPDKPGIKELLIQLQEAIEADPNLIDDDKQDALEEVKELAEAAKNPNDAEMKNKAKKADRMLGRIISAVPQATKLLEFCNNLLPLITKFFGF
jgi:hypothetical protein